MPQALDERFFALIDGQNAARKKIEDRVFYSLFTLWTRFDGWYVPRLVEEAAQIAWSAVRAGQVGTASIADAYMARTTTILHEEPMSGAGVNPALRTSLREGVTGPEVQARIAEEFRWQVYTNRDADQAMATALMRAEESMTQDLNLAFRQQSHAFMESKGIKTYRRVTRGEGTCGMCAAASNRVYYRDYLMPLHARCRCSMIAGDAILGGGRVLTDEDYKQLQGTSRTLYNEDLKDVRYVVDEHGELGPVLRNPGRATPKGDWRTREKPGLPRWEKGRDRHRNPEEKQLKVDHGMRAFRDVAKVDEALAGHRSMLEWVTRHGLDDKIAWQTERIRLLEQRRADIEAGRVQPYPAAKPTLSSVDAEIAKAERSLAWATEKRLPGNIESAQKKLARLREQRDQMTRNASSEARPDRER